MMKLLILIFAFAQIDSIGFKNELKKQAAQAYTKKQYQQSAQYLETLVDSFHVQDPNVLLNLSHSYRQLQKSELAEKHYAKALNSSSPELRSIAYQQLGVLEAKKQKLEKALSYFKKSLKENYKNEKARYNFELTKKLLEKKKEQDKQDKKDQKKQNKDKKDQNQQNKQKKDKDQKSQNQQQSKQKQKSKQQEDKKKEKESKQQEGKKKKQEQKQKPNPATQKSQRFKKIKMSLDRAKMILQAIKDKEIKYYQQIKKKSKSKRDNSKPDW